MRGRRWSGLERERISVALLCVVLSVFAIGAYRHRWLDDDGFINLRIVRNVLEGNGPVFNIDERVETGTSPLWIWILVAAGKLGARLERAAVGIGMALAIFGLGMGAAGGFWRAHDDESDEDGTVLLPFGALALAVIPGAWDYATSGLETGLTFAWLGASFLTCQLLLTRTTPAPRSLVAATGALVGLSVLVRPELALYSLAFFVVLWRLRPNLGDRLLLLVATLVVPAGYQLFRMGYYGALTPNTAIAKAAFEARWSQGLCYAKNFVRPYWLPVPISLLAVLQALSFVDLRRRKENASLLLATGVLVAAGLHTLYILRVGGDYMHARMFLPVAFAFALPVMTVPARCIVWAPRVPLVAVVGVPFLVWAALTAVKLRVPSENECGIGDERGWYTDEAHHAHPIALSDYEKHQFYKSALDQEAALGKRCPPTTDGKPPCRPLDLDATKHGILLPQAASYSVRSSLDPRVTAVTDFSAIGIPGYLVPDTMHVVDRIGLADPLTARFTLTKRGRVGHEHSLPNTWFLARFAEPLRDDDVGTIAARNALSCGALAELDQAVRAPLTRERFWKNVQQSFALQKLRVPLDPFAAEAEMCGVPVPEAKTGGGDGGDPYRWHCPTGAHVIGIRVNYDADHDAVAHAGIVCKDERTRRETASPMVGKGGSFSDVRCESGQDFRGVALRTDDLVRRASALCGVPGASDVDLHEVGGIGSPSRGEVKRLFCPLGQGVIGMAGRAGDRIDAFGVVCSP